MRPMTVGLALCLVLSTLSLAAGRPAAPDDAKVAKLPYDPASIHNKTGWDYRLPNVTSLAYSPDGRWVVAAFYIHAQNEPGTDWQSWVTEWNTETGERITLPFGAGPVAISDDSETLALNIYGRDENRMRGTFMLYKLGKDEPIRALAMPQPPPSAPTSTAPSGDGGPRSAVAPGRDGARPSNSVSSPEIIAATFGRLRSGGADFLMAMNEEGELLSWPRKVDKPATAYGKWDGLQNHRSSSGVTLEYAGGWGLVAVYPQGGAAACFYGNLAPDKNGKLYQEFQLGHWQQGVRLPSSAAFSRSGKYEAYSMNGKTIVCGKDARTLYTLPGGVCAAFGPEDKMVVADKRGIVRIWDLAAGRVEKVLRLDDRKEDTVSVAAVQCPSVFGDPEKNRKALADQIRNAAYGGAQIVVLPETSVTGYMSEDLKKTWQVEKRELSEGLEGVDPSKAAETVPGPSTRFFGQLADEYGVYLTVPLLEVDPKTGHYFNTSVLLGPDGKILIHYRKRNPWRWAEKGWATDGNLGNPVVDTPWGRLGVLICFDIHKQAAVMKEKKIDTLLYSIAWVEDKGSEWFAKELPAVAKKNGFNIVAANWTVTRNPGTLWYGYGQSRVIDKDGKILAESKDLFEVGPVFTEVPVPSK
jgi:predicted amidohydrolase